MTYLPNLSLPVTHLLQHSPVSPSVGLSLRHPQMPQFVEMREGGTYLAHVALPAFEWGSYSYVQALAIDLYKTA